jgi:hypothetical protein
MRKIRVERGLSAQQTNACPVPFCRERLIHEATNIIQRQMDWGGSLCAGTIAIVAPQIAQIRQINLYQVRRHLILEA